MQIQEQRYYSPEEYLDQEIASECRHEYIDGRIIPMTGGTPNHNQIALNLSGTLNFTLKRQPYRVFVTDQRLWIPKKRIHTYPDVMVVAGQIELVEGRKDTITNPLIIAEVLSNTNPLIIAEVLSNFTKSYDRDEKFAAYRTIPSFQEYLLIDQYKVHLEQYSKTENNKWIFSEYEDESFVLSLTSIQFQISLSDIYDKVDFAAEQL